MAGYVPIRIKITRGVDKRGSPCMVYPPFNELPLEVRGRMDWSAFLDVDCYGWFYDKVANLGTGEDEEFGCTLVPATFAEAAIAKWPDLVTALDEAAFATFHDERHAVRQPEAIINKPLIEDLLLRVQLEKEGLAPPPSPEEVIRRKRMCDPNDRTPGICHNPLRYWAERKAHEKIEVDAEACTRLCGGKPVDTVIRDA